MIFTVEVSYLIDTNAYFYIDDATNAGFLIDPGAKPEKLFSIVRERGWTIEKILLTHGHFDHFGAANDLREKLGAPIIIQANGKKYLSDPLYNLSATFGESWKIDDPVICPDDSEIALEKNPSFRLKLIPAPGHSEDGAIYYAEKDGVAFVGDTIFCGSVGRTDMPGGDMKTLSRTIREKIFTLPDGTILLSGHSSPTTVGNEKTNNPFV